MDPLVRAYPFDTLTSHNRYTLLNRSTDTLFRSGPAKLDSVLRFIQPERMDTRMRKRRNFSDQFKASVVLEALRGDKTVKEIAA